MREAMSSFSTGANAHTASLVSDGIAAAHKVMAAQISAIGKQAGVAVAWNPVPLDAFNIMAGFTRTGSPLADIFESANQKGAAAAGQALRTGVLLGRDSATVAKGVQNALGVSAYRSHLIARTELHRTARETQRGMMAANAHLYEGWTWRASLDGTSCAICWALDGKFFPTKYGQGTTDWHGAMNANAIPAPQPAWAASPYIPSMISHPNCRCAMVPRPRSFAEILGDPTIPDARSPFPPQVGKTRGERAFDALPDVEKLRILGPTRFKHYQEVPSLTQFLMVRPNPVWGDTLALRPLCR
jgi:hypothetical protein